MKLKIAVFIIFILAFIVTLGVLFEKNNIIYYFSIYLNPKPQPVKKQVIKPATSHKKLFYGASVDMSQILPGSTHYVINSKGEDLIDTAHHLGINLFRITSVQSSSRATTSAIYTKKQWDRVLNKMSVNGIKAVVLIESPTLSPKDFSNNYLGFVKDYIVDSGVLDNPDVYAVDLRNEPLINDKNLGAMSSAAKLIKEKYPNVKLTAGGWKSLKKYHTEEDSDPYIWQDSNIGKKLASFIDFYSLHIYGYDVKLFGRYPDPYNLTKFSIDKVAKSTDKPMLIEEFGAGNGDAITDQTTIGSSSLQATTYSGVYEELEDAKINQNILGSIAYTLYPRDRNTAGWNIVDQKGDFLYPAAYVLQKFATGKSDLEVDVENKNLPENYLLSQNDDHRTISVGLNDIIGIRIPIVSAFDSVKIADSTILLQAEPLTKNLSNNTEDLVFHAVKAGETEMQVLARGKAIFSVKVEVKDKKLKLIIP